MLDNAGVMVYVCCGGVICVVSFCWDGVGVFAGGSYCIYEMGR